MNVASTKLWVSLARKGNVMFIDARAIGFPLTDAILRHVESRLESALGPFAQFVVSVTARLQDVNANRGGIDKRCSVVVALRRRGVVAAEDTHTNLYVAVDTVAHRLRRAVKRAVKRPRSRQRKDPQRPGVLVTV
jgi:ribosomal subunit interface protein